MCHYFHVKLLKFQIFLKNIYKNKKYKNKTYLKQF